MRPAHEGRDAVGGSRQVAIRWDFMVIVESNPHPSFVSTKSNLKGRLRAGQYYEFTPVFIFRFKSSTQFSQINIKSRCYPARGPYLSVYTDGLISLATFLICLDYFAI